ncbi:class I SAM-dependent methyltransferase [Kutzneria sp. NPDC052558]|uniref:class I SAM-dependent methyltransferase n=1 Tax=Kutzneria sp. NPDC052558 TaxID=3364121 RepID=UPI0037CB74AB
MSELDRAAAVLRALPWIRDTAVRDTGTGPAISVLPRADDGVVESWQAIFEDCYELAAADECPETAATTGWTNSFTGEPIPADQMAEWVDTTVSRIAGLRPRRILEIGVGTGMLLRELVNRLEPTEYTATDLSSQAVDFLRPVVDELAAAHPGVALSVTQAPADAPPPSRHPGYDLVLVNSVVQYFPSTVYLESVLAGALAELAPGGHVFLGDLRNSLLLKEFACLKHEHRGADLVAEELDGDGELSLSPAYVDGLAGRLAGVTAVEVAPRRGHADNEMTIFRYDAVLHTGCAVPTTRRGWMDGGNMTIDQVDGLLAHSGEAFGLAGVRNARLARARQLTGDADAADRPGIDPEALCRLGERHGRRVLLRWSRAAAAGDLDVWFPVPGEDTHFRVSVPDAARPTGEPDQPVFPPGSARQRRDELVSLLARELPGLPTPELVFVASLP